MQRTLLFKFLITLIILIFLVNGQTCPCTPNDDILQCYVTSPMSSLDTSSCNPNGYNLINITYSGSVVLNLITSSTNPISIQPVDDSDSHTLQISNITTNAIRIDIKIHLSLNQILLSLFSTPSYIIAPTSALSINVVQNVSDISNFTIFGYTTLSQINLADYKVIFNTDVPYSGVLNFPDLIRGITNIPSITISGNNHTLAVDATQMPLFMNVNKLSLKNLRLYDQILYNITNLQEYIIEQCEYNRTAQFLNSNINYNISITMENNIPLDLVLPNDKSAFQQLGTLKSVTLIEPNLNSSCLRTLENLKLSISLFLQLGSYFTSDFQDWQNSRPLIRLLTMMNILDLDIFPSKFFNRLDPITQVTLQGTFGLEKTDICAFVGINIQPNPILPIISLNSSKQYTADWNICADTYIIAINQRTIQGIECPPDGSYGNCAHWADVANQCNLISFENACPGQTLIYGNNFFYNGSYLYQFFQSQSWLNQTTNPTPTPTPNGDSMNIGAIIGAVCGLLVAITILVITIYCVYRYRQKNLNGNHYSMSKKKYIPSSDDGTHVSIATSKTSKSSRYQLQKSFFPPMQPNDQIAPPLYTAPSESVGSISVYNSPSAPSAPRDSISTHATHVYETVGSQYTQ